MAGHGPKTRVRLMCGAAVSLALLAGAAYAEDSGPISIAPQPLASALYEFGVKTGHQVLFTPALAQAKTTRGVAGVADQPTALAQLLDGTGLTWKRSDDTYLILKAGDAGPQDGSAGGGAETNVVQELVVTAQKKSENIQVVPIAISAFSQADLTTRQVAGGPDLMTQVPNMTFTKTNFTSYSIQIRGIGTQAISATTDPAVAVMFNNTPFLANHFFEQEFYDLERVEVLRGPQGTLYGRNATAGVVNVISAKPSFDFEAKLSGDIANYGSHRLEGMVNLPLAEDKVALRIAGAWTKRDGFVKNILTGDQTDGRDLWSTRVSLRAEPTDRFNINLIWEHFSENDDRLRSGKQLCHTDPGPSEVNGKPVEPSGAGIDFGAAYFSQGCLPSSLYSPDSFQTPNGFALPYYGAAGQLGSPVYVGLNPYASALQSRNLREIETHLKPDYEANADVAELQLSVDLTHSLSLTSETGFSRDFIFSFEDFNRFDTTPGVFRPGGNPGTAEAPGPFLDLVSLDGVFCDPQLGCTNRLAAGDLAEARSKQFSQEFRLSSNFDGPFNFNLGANFLRYDTEIKYYVFINTLTAYEAFAGPTDIAGGVDRPRLPWVPGVSDNIGCVTRDFFGPITADPNLVYGVNCAYIDPNDIHHLNDNGRNYFLSRNPYHLLSYAAFGEAYYNITSDLKLTAGFRWTVDKKTAPQLPSWLLAGNKSGSHATDGSYGTPTRKVIELDWSEPTGRVALDWRPKLSFTDESLFYASYVRGYKAGGANPPPPVVVLPPVCPPACEDYGVPTDSAILAASLTHPETFKPEFVNAFEVGTKNTLLDGRMTLNLGAFFYDYKGYQISQIVDRAAVNLNFDATVKGLEIEMDYKPLKNLRLGFKGGYEDTQVADGSKAIDLMDRTAGTPGWILVRPFPTQSSNCVFPEKLATIPLFTQICSSYIIGLDPVTFLPYVPNPTKMVGYNSGNIVDLPPELQGYPGFDPASANHGEGFTKDLSGNELPNAPHYTATITIDYTLPLPHDWLATLHTDLYYQSEAWTRIFNTPGYDKLKAYNNINVAAIFSNERAGLTVMTYVKNVLDRDSITGAFLNSDDTGLTTNVFLTEPRIYGIKVTKQWTGSSGWAAANPDRRAGDPYPITVELGAQAQWQDGPGEAVMPFYNLFPSGIDPRLPQNDDSFEWKDGRQMRLIYQPPGSSWRALAAVRFGRTGIKTFTGRQEEAGGPAACRIPTTGPYGPIGKIFCDPDYGPIVLYGQTIENKYDPDNLVTPIDRVGSSVSRREQHLLVDFAVGRDIGLGLLGEGRSWLSAGLRIAQFKSSVKGDMTGVPDLFIPDGYGTNYSTFHHYVASFDSERKFTGAGPTLSWEASRRLLGDDQTGRVNLDWSLTGGVLFGKQETATTGMGGSSYFSGYYRNIDWNRLPAVTQAPMNVPTRDKSAIVPLVDLSAGISYEFQRFKLSAGYRWERYFKVLDAGYLQHRSYDRTIDGPYFKASIGFGG